MARRRKGRDVNGILLLDKPSGLTSNRALQRAKGLLFARKAGHTGSLDPLASGLLPLCFGHATKISGYLLDAAKTYEVTAAFGARTDTGDADGEVIETSDQVPSSTAIDRVIPQCIGEQQQIPPMYSAIKQEGRRLYSLARQGKVVERPARDITIYELERRPSEEGTLALRVVCSKGTYIRTLIEDIAEKMGALAHVTALRRTGAGPFDDSQLVTLEALEARVEAGGPEAADELLLPLDRALDGWPAVQLDADSGYYLLNGQPVQAPEAPHEGAVKIYVDELGLVGLGEILPDGRVAPKRLFR